MSFRLFVGNLPYSATEDEVRGLFEQIGTVESVTIVVDRATGQPRGFGFVEMSSADDGRRAITTLNGTNLHDRALTVNEARPREQRGGGSGGPRGPRPGRRF
jgi:RNA recognition motif-containing protein